MKVKTVLIGGAIAVGAVGLLWLIFRPKQTTTVVGAPVPGTSAGGFASGWGGGDWGAFIAAGTGAIGNLGDKIAGWFKSNDDQTPTQDSGYAGLPNAGQLQF